MTRNEQSRVDLILARAARKVHGHNGPGREHIGKGQARQDL